MQSIYSIAFEKFHGNGNDFIFVHHKDLNCFESMSQLKVFAQKICDRHFGIGADGVLFCDDENQELFIINSDGSLAATCGNALRCYGLKLLRSKHWDGKTAVRIKRLSVSMLAIDKDLPTQENFAIHQGEVFATLLEGSLDTEQISVGMGLEKQVEVLSVVNPNWVGSDSLLAVYVELANPHLVFVSSLFNEYTDSQYIQFSQWAQGDLLTQFSGKIPLSNISMISASKNKELKDHEFQLVVYERGAGLTLCCGSGAVASRVALESLDFVSPQADNVDFHLPGGPVKIKNSIIQEKKQRLLCGPAKYIYKGILEWY